MAMKNPVHPGKIAKHAIEATGLNLTESAERLGVSRVQLSRLVNENADLSPEMAVRLSKAFGSTTEHWMRMQFAYDLAKVQRTARSIKVKRFPKAEALPI